MRKISMLGGAAVGLVVLGGTAASGCFNSFSDCDLSATCPPPADGGGGGGNPACEADPTQDPAAVIEDCGVFVSASAAPGGDGTRERPFQSFAEAAAAKPKRVYACAEEYAEMSGVSFDGGVEIYAGFTECSGAWAWSASARGTLQGSAGEVALTLLDGESRVVSLNVVAASAMQPGGSSIAVVASGGSVAILNGDLTASDAMDGAAGESPPADATLNGDPGSKGADVCAGGETNPGAPATMKMCAADGSSSGGKGGDGGPSDQSPAGDGEDGTPPDPMFPMFGIGGTGEGQGMPPATVCTSGADGAPGAPGTSGPGASGIGTISATGYTGVEGTPGTNGQPGQGGGGGGAAKGGTGINCGMGAANRVGASGGAGGTGGCGGQGGGGGQAGGSSIALVVVEAAVTLNGVTLSAGKAGDGGIGGDGQGGGQKGLGGAPGAGAAGVSGSCGGGDGGQGGTGGPGGGGQGGHTLGIAFQGSIAPTGGEFSIDPQNSGIGGPGGANNSTPEAGKGTDGLGANCWDFAGNMNCGG